MVNELSNPTTVQRQFDAIINGVEQEALAAAHTLGIKGKSRQAVLAAVCHEHAYWGTKYDVDALTDAVMVGTDRRKFSDRALCLGVIELALNDWRQYLAESNLLESYAWQSTDRMFALLHRRLVTAARTAPAGLPKCGAHGAADILDHCEHCYGGLPEGLAQIRAAAKAAEQTALTA